jgi:hypothetical protein
MENGSVRELTKVIGFLLSEATCEYDLAVVENQLTKPLVTHV